MMASKKQKKNEMNVEDVRKLLVFTATRFQQDFYELLSDWNEYDPRKPYILKNFIGTVIFGSPQADANEALTAKDSLSSAEDSLFVYKPDQMKRIDSLYAKIVEHGTQNTKDEKILCGILYNVVFHKKSMKSVLDLIHKEDDFNGDWLMTYVSQYPIFKVMKNITRKIGEERKTVKMENYYIDDSGRVYKSWTDYLKSNVLPPCVMVVPHGGEYQGDGKEQWSDKMSYVWVDVQESPACNKKILNVLDTSSSVLSIGGMALSVAAAFTPVGAAVAAAGGLGMGVSAVWTIGRSSQELVDRSKHDQSINVMNKEGFTCWFGIASSTLAVASAGGTAVLSRAIKNGTTITKAAQTLHDGVKIGAFLATGVTAGLSFYNMCDSYKKNRTVSAQDVLNFTSSILLLGNSIVNMKLSRSIIESQQNSIINDFESSLRSERHRTEFQKMVENTNSNIANPTKAKNQIIRRINKIQNKNDITTLIQNNNKSFASVGSQFIINEKTLISPVDFLRNMAYTPVSMNSVATKSVIEPQTTAELSNESIFGKSLHDFLESNAKRLAAFVKPKIGDFTHVLTRIRSFDEAGVVFSKLLYLGIEIAVMFIQEEYPATNLLVKAVEFFWDYIKENMKGTSSEMCGEPKEFREAMKLLLSLYPLVEGKLEEWVAFFKKYLRTKLEEVEDGVKNACSSHFHSASRSFLPNGTIS